MGAVPIYKKRLLLMMDTLLGGLAIPNNRILFLHVALKELKLITQKSYSELTREILSSLSQLYHPKTILVPSYTFRSFILSGVFHRHFSHSEVGRFSEEVRLHHAKYRTPDAMWSVVDTGDYLRHLDLDYSRNDFLAGSLFDVLNQEDYIIVNVGLTGSFATQIHCVERACEVDYRLMQTFEGVYYDDPVHWKPIAYETYMRRFNSEVEYYPSYNNIKRENYLLMQEVLQYKTLSETLKISWISSQTLTETLTTAVELDKSFLVT
jgi:hypothetical protein